MTWMTRKTGTTLAMWRLAAVRGVMTGGVVLLAGVAAAQKMGPAPRYQSPINAPVPQPLALPVPAAITPNATVVEDVIVRVNDQIISRSDLERSQQQLLADSQQANASPAEVAARQKDMLRDMIDQQLLISRGKELGLNADAEVIRRLDEIRKQNKMDTMEDLEKAARQQGVSFEDFKASIRNSVITQQVVRDEVGRRLQMTPAQEQAYYEAHKAEFTQPEQVRLSEILIPTPENASDAVVKQAETKADDVKAKLAAGAKFEDAAKIFSGGPTAAQGGDLGLFKRGALAKVLEDQTFGLKAGESTAPIRTRQGFVILKVTEHMAAGVPAMKDIEPQLQEAMYTEQMQPALRAYLTKLREEAYIDIKPGFVDTGSSAKQTKPVFTAYAPPVPKKKSTAQKQRLERGGGRTSSGVAVGASNLANVPTATSGPVAVTPVVMKNGKPVAAKKVKIHREKVRLGQAPRNSLPAGPEDTAMDAGLGRPKDPGEGAAPGTAIAPLESTSTVADASMADPLAPPAPELKKTRYASRAKEQALMREEKKIAKAKEKAALKPVAVTAEEKAAEQTQSAPLGLAGDTAKKPKKAKRAKGAPKERLQEKVKVPEAAPTPVSPMKTGHQGVGSGAATAPAATPAATPQTDQTALPAAGAGAAGTVPATVPGVDPAQTRTGVSAPPK